MYDVIIVGSSFSGLMAATATAKSDKVLLIEKRKQPGSPVNSTGAVPIEWLNKMNVMPPGDAIAGNLCGVELIAPSGEAALLKKSVPDGMVLYPDRFVKWLSEKAADMGCQIMPETVFKGLSVEKNAKGKDESITVSTSKGEFKTRYVVGADGAATNVGRVAGVGERPKPEDLHIGIEYTITNNDGQDPEVYRLYLGHEVAPLGYAWSFPEGPNHVKIGLGIPESVDTRAKALMDRFISKYPQFKSPILKSNGGIIPTAPPLKTAVKGNVVLVGDAAHFCSPLHGGGIWFGMQSGYLAGKALSQGNPQLYDEYWKEQLGGVLSRHYKLKKVIYSMSDKNFEDLITLMKKYLASQSSNPGLAKSLRMVFFSDPGFVFDMMLKWGKQGLAIDVIKRLILPDFRIA